MLISAAFPRRFAIADDIGDQTPTLRVARVTTERVGPTDKPVVWFFGARKGIVLSATLARQIAAIGSIGVQALKTVRTAARAYGPEALTPADLATVTTADLLADLDKLGRKTLPPYRHIRQAIENRQEP